MNATGKTALKYVTLPGIIPRVLELFGSGFVYVAFFIARLYGALRLLPAEHPYLNPSNIGRFGIRHVIAQAADNLVISVKNIDQIIVFILVLVGLILLMSQVILFGAAIFLENPVMAQAVNSAQSVFPASVQDIFSVNSRFGHGNGNPSQDLAFIIMDRIFGLQGIYNSCVSTFEPCLNASGQAVGQIGQYPSAFHLALHKLLEFYSYGVFLVAVIILLYFFAVIVVETAQTGTPFGGRTNRLWAPIRLIVFFALLMPVGGQNVGINGAQYIAFWTAKFGSNFATNSWGYFNSKANIHEWWENEKLIMRPKVGKLDELAQFVFLAKTCMQLEQIFYDHENTNVDESGYFFGGVYPYVVHNAPLGAQAAPDDFTKLTYAQAVVASSSANLSEPTDRIIISVGLWNPNKKEYADMVGNVNPMCGQLTIPINSTDKSMQPVYEAYYNLVQAMWAGVKVSNSSPPFDVNPIVDCFVDQENSKNSPSDCQDYPSTQFGDEMSSHYQVVVEEMMSDITQPIIENYDMTQAAHIQQKGWAGAAIWFNKIAQINGAIVDAVSTVPYVTRMPYVMEYVAEKKFSQNEDIDFNTLYLPVWPDVEPDNKSKKEADFWDEKRSHDKEIAVTLHKAYTLWSRSRVDDQTSRDDSVFITFINAIFGVSKIFDIRNNPDVNPLAHLTSLGKSMMSATLRNLSVGFLTGMAGKKDTLLKGAGDFMQTIGFVTLIVSFILYYVLPFMPFLYFFFALSGWVKSIFEAIVAMPLWALSHIRIDGDGLPGNNASAGYFLLFEIFLRPILMLFGLMASIIFFSATVSVLHDVFNLVAADIQSASGEAGNTNFADYLRSPVDHLFYTVMYTVLCYMTGLACFKMIDQIPQSILRFMGEPHQTFQEAAGDPAGDISGVTFKGGTLLTQNLTGGQVASILNL